MTSREIKPYPKWVVNKEGVRVIVQNKEEHEQVCYVEEVKPVEEKSYESKSSKKSKPSSW